MKHAEDKLYELWKQTTLNATSDEAIYRWDTIIWCIESLYDFFNFYVWSKHT
jgi:hypothetical protein